MTSLQDRNGQLLSAWRREHQLHSWEGTKIMEPIEEAPTNTPPSFSCTDFVRTRCPAVLFSNSVLSSLVDLHKQESRKWNQSKVLSHCCKWQYYWTQTHSLTWSDYWLSINKEYQMANEYRYMYMYFKTLSKKRTNRETYWTCIVLLQLLSLQFCPSKLLAHKMNSATSIIPCKGSYWSRFFVPRKSEEYVLLRHVLVPRRLLFLSCSSHKKHTASTGW